MDIPPPNKEIAYRLSDLFVSCKGYVSYYFKDEVIKMLRNRREHYYKLQDVKYSESRRMRIDELEDILGKDGQTN